MEIKHSWPKGTYVAIGDPMFAGIDERKKSFPGATCSDMYNYLVPILEKKTDHVILHVGTNNVAHYIGTEIVDKLLELKLFIVKQLPTTHIVIFHPIKRTDSKHFPFVKLYANNSIFGYLSINSLINKITQLRKVGRKDPIDLHR